MVGVPTLSVSVNMSDNVVKTREYRPVSCVIFSVLAVILVVADQLLKRAVVKNIGVYEQVDVIKGFFSLYHCRNTGSAFSLFADKPWGIYLLTGISVVLGLGIFFLMLYAALYDMKLLSVAFCLLSSGAIGNLIDRFALKYVVDFLRFDFGSYTFPIFNFADICAVIGTGLLICIILFGSKYFEEFWNLLTKKGKTKDAA